MEVYTLDPLLRRDQVIDRFESLIWTERFASWGDFELDVYSTMENRNLLTEGTHLAMNESHRMMTVETIEDGVDQEGKAVLKVSGRSIESVTEERVAKKTMSNLTTEPKWVLTGKPADVAKTIFREICINGKLSAADKIPFVREGRFLPDDTIPAPVDPITLELPPMTVYKAVKDICDVWNLGFRLLRRYDTSQLYWDVYTGSDRTTGQKALAPVIFAPNLDNLQNTKYLTSIEKEKNVAYVFSPAGFKVVYPPEVDPSISGFERRVLVVQADDITTETPNVDSALIQRGREELAKNRKFQAFDGEISQRTPFKYGVDYHLGDLVEMRNLDGVTNTMRVTEQIFVSDREGERSYPTLAVNLFINTGSWLSWESNKRWADYETDFTTVWGTLP